MWRRVVCVLATLATVARCSDGLFALNVIHYNDFHAHFDEVSPQGGPCVPGQEPCIGGFARLTTAVNQALEVEPDSLLLNAGDTFQGTIWYNFLRWNVSQHFMNMLPHDAHVLGNHEFDHGVSGLLPYLQRLDAPVLGANVNTTFEPSLAPYVRNHVVVERRNRRIGIIGVLLQVFSAPIGQVIMEDDVEAVNREAAILTAQGVDIIILLTHVGYERDMALATLISSDVDIIVGGHSHSLLYTGEPPNGDSALGDYPTVITQANGHRIPIVQASCYTRYLGNIMFYIDDQGIVQHWEGQPVFLGTSIIPDPEMVELLEPWREEVDAVGKEVLGTSLVTLNRSWCRQRECNMGSWACDGFLEEAQRVDKPLNVTTDLHINTIRESIVKESSRNISASIQVMPRAVGSAWNDAHVCLINAGGLRTQINPGNVTTEGLLMAMPFENYVQVFDLKGAHLLEALEFSVGTFQPTPGEFSSSRMLQIGGMRNTYNASQPAGARVAAAVRCVACAVPRYEPLDPARTYRVLTQSYIGDGGGGFTMLSEHRENVVNLDVDYVMLQRYMRRQRSVLQDLDGRIQVVW